jgi:hypothetical protein
LHRSAARCSAWRRELRVRIVEVVYQTERAGIFHH